MPLKSLGQEAFAAARSRRSEPEIDGVSDAVDGEVEMHPFSAHLDVDTVWTVKSGEQLESDNRLYF